MKIIDAHLHLTQNDNFDTLAVSCRNKNTIDCVQNEFAKNNIVLGVAMGNRPFDDNFPGGPLFPNLSPELLPGEKMCYPPPFACCLGLRGESLNADSRKQVLHRFGDFLTRFPFAAGIKIYTGYDRTFAYDTRYHPFFDLAGQLNVPVVFHMGDTAGGRGLLKYAHPLTVDEAATEFPNTQFVIAHMGSPWFADAAQVAVKNKNVAIDLSGLAVGYLDIDRLFSEQPGFICELKTWLSYLGDYSRILYGSDWPLVNMGRYIELIRRLIPEAHHNDVFYENARRVFPRIVEFC